MKISKTVGKITLSCYLDLSKIEVDLPINLVIRETILTIDKEFENMSIDSYNIEADIQN